MCRWIYFHLACLRSQMTYALQLCGMLAASAVIKQNNGLLSINVGSELRIMYIHSFVLKVGKIDLRYGILLSVLVELIMAVLAPASAPRLV